MKERVFKKYSKVYERFLSYRRKDYATNDDYLNAITNGIYRSKTYVYKVLNYFRKLNNKN